MHERYGVDVGSGILDRRSWRWLKVRIEGLLAVPSAPSEYHTDKGLKRTAIHQTRVGLALEPPD